ncbi:MAG TPA: hypothetical protein VGO64_00485 [Candidatus Limnocylindrales bacterium]|nr:hypothetical protein [Candidatus Limnocylindrales bacterium]
MGPPARNAALRPGRAALVALLATILVGAAPATAAASGPAARPMSVAPTAEALPAVEALPTVEAAKPYRLDLARGGDFVAQRNFVQCVGASMQMMLNIADAKDDRSSSTQLRLQNLARSLSGPVREGFQRKGASVRGWSAGLNTLDAGPYRLVGATTLDEALRFAAVSIRTTGKPVGLLVWAGRHAWVMSGFQATADPARTNAFEVTRAIVLDPLYPHGSKQWGKSPKPREAITPAALGKQFVPRRKGTWAGAVVGTDGAATMSALAGKYVLVLPYIPIGIARTRHVAS